MLTGYRRWDVSFGACLRSLFQLHNETGNIWTHLLGFLYFGSLLHSTLSELPEASDAERLAIGSFLVGCMVCMGLSVAYHTFGSLSRRAHDVLLRLDYTGITVQILCSFVPCVYYWSPPALQAAYLAGLTLVCAVALVLIQCYLFGHASRRPQRTLVYTLLGGCVAMPLLHGLAHDWGDAALRRRRAQLRALVRDGRALRLRRPAVRRATAGAPRPSTTTCSTVTSSSTR